MNSELGEVKVMMGKAATDASYILKECVQGSDSAAGREKLEVYGLSPVRMRQPYSHVIVLWYTGPPTDV